MRHRDCVELVIGAAFFAGESIIEGDFLFEKAVFEIDERFGAVSVAEQEEAAGAVALHFGKGETDRVSDSGLLAVSGKIETVVIAADDHFLSEIEVENPIFRLHSAFEERFPFRQTRSEMFDGRGGLIDENPEVETALESAPFRLRED